MKRIIAKMLGSNGNTNSINKIPPIIQKGAYLVALINFITSFFQKHYREATNHMQIKPYCLIEDGGVELGYVTALGRNYLE